MRIVLIDPTSITTEFDKEREQTQLPKIKSPTKKKNQSQKQEQILNNNSKLFQTQPQVISRKEVKINLKKITVSKSDQDKYNRNTYQIDSINDSQHKTNIISDDLPIGIINKNVLSLKVNEILKPTTLTNLKQGFERSEIIKSNLFKVDEQHFRSVFEPSNRKKFQIQLSKEIERDKTNLIKYLHSKEDISKLFIERLSKLDDNKLTKMNRICKIYFHYENFDRKEKQRIKEKLEEAEKVKKREVANVVNSLSETLKMGESVVKGYKHIKLKNVKAYEDIHHFFKVKNWSKLNNKRLYSSQQNDEDDLF